MNAPTAKGLRNPYVGTEAFQEGQELFGRDREREELADLLISRRIVLLYSPSGAGKTSVVQAALIPELKRRHGFEVMPILRVSYTSGAPGCGPGECANRYVLSVQRCLEQCFPLAERLADAELDRIELDAYLLQHRQRRQRQATSGPQRAFDLLVFDQFEEAFTLDPIDQNRKRDFFRQLGVALGAEPAAGAEAQREARARWALFVMREDHIAELDDYRTLIPTALETTYRMSLLGHEAAAKAIEKPAQALGVNFADAAVRKLVDDLRTVRVQTTDRKLVTALHEYVEPVQLEVVCQMLWDKTVKPEHLSITEADLRQAGAEGEVAAAEVDAALAAYFDRQVTKVAVATGVKERDIRDWVEHELITASRVRSLVLLGVNGGRVVDDRAIRALIDAHLLRHDRRGEREWVELAHDRLIDPVLKSNSVWREQHLSLLQRQAAAWTQGGKADGLLLRGRALAEAGEWAQQHEAQLEETDHEFLGACRRERKRMQGRRWLWVSTVATVIAVTTLFSYHRVVQRQDELALVGQLVAEAELVGTQMDPTAGVRKLLLATAKLDEALGRFGAHDDLVAAGRTIEGSLVSALRALPPVRIAFREHNETVRGLAFGATGDALLSAGDDHLLRFWDARTGVELSRSVELPGTVLALAYNPRRGLAVAGDQRGNLMLWRVQDRKLEAGGQIGPQLFPHGRRVSAVAFNDAGTRLVSAGRDRRLLVWDMTDAGGAARASAVEIPGAATYHTASIDSIVLSRDGDTLVSGDQAGGIVVWSGVGGVATGGPAPSMHALQAERESDEEALPAGSPESLPPRIPVAVQSLALSRDSRWLAAGGHEGSVMLWDLEPMHRGETPRRPVVLRGLGGHQGVVHALAFSNDGETLASAGADKTVLLWHRARAIQWTPARPLPIAKRFGTLPERVFSLGFDPNDDRLLAVGTTTSVLLMDTLAPANRLSTVLAGADPDPTRGARWQSVVVAADADVVAAVRGDLIHVWRAQEMGSMAFSAVASPAIHAGATRVALNASGTLLASANDYGQIVLWQLDGNNLERIGLALSSAGAPRVRGISLAFNRKGNELAASIENAVLVWDVSDPSKAKPLLQWRHPEDKVMRAVAFSPTRNALAAAGEDGRVRLWPAMDGGEPRVSATEHGRDIVALAFSPDGSTLVSAGWDSHVVAWRAEDLSLLGNYDRHERGLRALAFGGLGGRDRLFSSDLEGNVLMWLSFDDARHVRPLVIGPGRGTTVAASGSADLLVTAGDELVAWNLSKDSIYRHACAVAGSLATDAGEALAHDPCRRFKGVDR